MCSNGTDDTREFWNSVELTDHDHKVINRRKQNIFSNFPNWKKSNLHVKLKDRIRRENLQWGHRLFFTRDYIDPEARCSWCDFYFPSIKSRFINYSAYIHLCQETLEEVAEKVLEKELDPLYVKYIGYKWEMKVVERDAWGKPVTYTDADPDRYTRTYPELDNLSYFDYRKKRITEYLQENKPVVYENYKVDVNEGRYGLFLVMEVDEDIITADIINKRIEHFYNLGEPLSWQAENPVPENKLIYSSDWLKQRQLSLGNALLYDIDKKI